MSTGVVVRGRESTLKNGCCLRVPSGLMPPPRSRKLNVQQQNALTEESIRSTAIHWRRNPIPEALRATGIERGVQWEKSIVLNLDFDYPGMPQLFGSLLTQDERFIDFAIDTDEAHLRVELVNFWKDETADQNTSSQNRGFGQGRGAIAIKVLRALNIESATQELSTMSKSVVPDNSART